MKQLLSVTCNIKISKALFPEDIDRKIQDLPNKLPTLIHALSSRSPYINRLICTEMDWLVGVIDNEIEDVLNQIVANCKKNLKNDTFSKLRIAKRRTNLVILLADFGNLFNLVEVTNSLSTFAENILELVMDLYVFNEFDRMDYRSLFKDKNDYPNKICYSSLKSGLCVLGMGKLGSFELNYSSDIDLIFLFDEEKYKPEFYSKIRNAFIVIIRKIVKALSEVTAEGFVFRVDLRLRPDPSSNPICIGALVAQRYYENFGRNWERAIFIKARAIAGDKTFGRKFLGSLTSFVWRKNLDFAAIEDINNIRKKIRKKTPRVLNANLLGYNIKSGLGGIREIEFFAQTQQLIRGGKNKSLRENATVNVLKQLKKTDLIIGSVEKKLIQSYEQLRFLEHILQLMEDSQTH
ncbi:MAG: glutamine-synthetase adenylyltransferase, partial [Paracoccaceae bacterium]|nr:glutamine-synthetase adenylyltransferase [Paracoccaceae bacterium]